MAGLDDIAKMLALESVNKQQIAQNNPWTGGANFANQLSQTVLGSASSPQYSNTEKIIGGLVTGLGSGLLSGKQQQYQGRAEQEYQNALASSITGQAAPQRDYLSPSVFNDAQNKGSIWKIKQSMAQDQKNDEYLKDIKKSAMLESIKRDPRALERVLKLGNEPENKPIATAAGAEGVLLEDGNIGGGVDSEAQNIATPVSNSKQKLYEIMDDQGVSYDDAIKIQQKQLDYDRQNKKDLIGFEDKARNDLRNTFTSFQDLKSNFDTMKSVYPYNDRQSTSVLLQSFARVQDPGSTVRGAELENGENTQAMLQRMGYSWTSLITGEQQMSPTDKLKLINAAGIKYNQTADTISGAVERQRNLVSKRGGDPSNVFSQIDTSPFEMFNWLDSTKGKQTTLEQQLKERGIELDSTTEATRPTVARSALLAEAQRRGLVK